MSDDTYYINTHEAALAVVATSMKKARLKIDTLILNSIMGGMLFSCGGMLHLLAQAECPGIYASNPGIIRLLQGSLYPFGLFYVVNMGADLFNSNILFFTVGVLRGAVTILDLVISWTVSFFGNLAGNLFVCYVICHLSKTTQDANMVAGSIEIVDQKMAYSFIETLIKSIPCNFCVCLAIYLQIMAKPLHVKFLMMYLPVCTFVSMGFNHVVADMYLIPIGLLNGAPHSVGAYIWKLMIPAAIGNCIGGIVFGVWLPWYSHLIVVEKDKKQLNLPEFDERDEQPELNMDSRVVRVKSHISSAASSNNYMGLSSSSNDFEEKDKTNNQPPQSYFPASAEPQQQRVNEANSIIPIRTNFSTRSGMSSRSFKSARSTGLQRNSSAVSTRSRLNKLRPVVTTNSAEFVKSPRNVFPVANMGAPDFREKSIADPNTAIEGEYQGKNSGDNYINNSDEEGYDPNPFDPEKETISGNLRRIITRVKSRKEKDIESTLDNDAIELNNYANAGASTKTEGQPSDKNKNIHLFKKNYSVGDATRPHSHSNRNRFLSFGKGSTGDTYYDVSRKASAAGITQRAANMADDIAGIHTDSINVSHHQKVDDFNHSREESQSAGQGQAQNYNADPNNASSSSNVDSQSASAAPVALTTAASDHIREGRDGSRDTGTTRTRRRRSTAAGAAAAAAASANEENGVDGNDGEHGDLGLTNNDDLDEYEKIDDDPESIDSYLNG
ncbi:hypothetical protein PACTADRAFT_48824 [Pachysolen tannophilus NRRL Y-2460]|uniref:Formate/nitrite transporter n=1 Tax=Pachysolen tannophilus NRRL Y-2460 TaxID=669874 RepID=A0A1E4TZ94_PACTA|nr:hypothetical protein PACTADRAFT_48824 [Pachysolen tannophilus NRRL Y-2460]